MEKNFIIVQEHQLGNRTFREYGANYFSDMICLRSHDFLSHSASISRLGRNSSFLHRQCEKLLSHMLSMHLFSLHVRRFVIPFKNDLLLFVSLMTLCGHISVSFMTLRSSNPTALFMNPRPGQIMTRFATISSFEKYLVSLTLLLLASFAFKLWLGPTWRHVSLIFDKHSQLLPWIETHEMQTWQIYRQVRPVLWLFVSRQLQSMRMVLSYWQCRWPILV